MTFWEHLDELRLVLVKTVIVTVSTGVVMFCFKDILFDIVLAPSSSDFITYRLLDMVCNILGTQIPSSFHVSLVNTELAEQFLIHVKTAMFMGMLCASPYILCQFFLFVAPALYVGERRYGLVIVSSGYAMFLIGVLVNYLIIFPLTFRFFGTYQVSADVANMVTLQSYMNTLIMMSLSLGLVFEMPIIIWLLSRIGIISSLFLKKHRRHAVVLILVLAAIITPTSDVFTLILVSLPMCILYEISIIISK
ncbi:MAG: twin-arginine translocase subunit TatC [Prevotella sp.]